MPQKLKIETASVESLIPYANNARTHSEEQVAQIAASIQEFGFNNPVLVDREMGIIAGHGRVLAARKLGLDSVPIIRLDHLTEYQKKAFILADNKLALNAGWDDALLKLELDELGGNIDLGLAGFSEEELGKLLEADLPGEGERDGDAPVNFVIQYNIVFDDEGQQSKWFDLLRRLKETYPDAETIGQRLANLADETLTTPANGPV